MAERTVLLDATRAVVMVGATGEEAMPRKRDGFVPLGDVAEAVTPGGSL